jgi:hypothetical protein
MLRGLAIWEDGGEPQNGMRVLADVRIGGVRAFLSARRLLE